MKRGFPLLLIALILLPAAFAPAAYGADYEYYSIRRYGNEFQVASDDVPLVEFPAAEITAALAVAEDGSAVAAVGSEAMLETVEAVVSGDAVRIAVAAASDAENAGAPVSTLSVSMPGDALMAVARRTEADLQIVTELGQMILPNSAVASIAEKAGGSDVTFVMAHEPLGSGHDPDQGGTVTEVGILCGGQSVASWEGGEVVLRLPVSAGYFEPDLSCRVVQTDADNTSSEHAGLCVEDASGLYAEISTAHLSTFTVLAEAAKETAHAAQNSMVQSPLAAGIGVENGGGTPYLWTAAGGLALAACVFCGAVIWRRRNGRA